MLHIDNLTVAYTATQFFKICLLRLAQARLQVLSVRTVQVNQP